MDQQPAEPDHTAPVYTAAAVNAVDAVDTAADSADVTAVGDAAAAVAANGSPDVTGTASAGGPGADVPPAPRTPVVLTIPADRTLVVLVRSAAGHLGARAGLSFQELDDLRLAVDEACALLLLPDEIGATGDTLECRFAEVDGALLITVAADARPGSAPQVGGFGWNLLSSLVDELDWSSADGRAEVRLVKGPAARGR